MSRNAAHATNAPIERSAPKNCKVIKMALLCKDEKP